MSATVDVPTFSGIIVIETKASASVVFVGANGSGKTRLGVLLDALLSKSGQEVHRIAAHRSLKLNPDVVPPSFEVATNRLYYGYDKGGYQHKVGHRFQSNPETILLNDFDHVLSALYAENNDVSITYRQTCINTPNEFNPPPPAKIDKLKAIWEAVLPHRKLVIFGGNVKTKLPLHNRQAGLTG